MGSDYEEKAADHDAACCSSEAGQTQLARRSDISAVPGPDELDGETAIVDVAAAKESQHVWVGYDAESRKAWRQVEGEPRQYCTEWLLEDAVKPTDVARVRQLKMKDEKHWSISKPTQAPRS